MNITEFILDRVAEDEAVARAATGDHWHGQACEVRTVPDSTKTPPWAKIAEMHHSNHFADALHIARHDPARVLAECAAKRAIVELHANEGADWDLAYCAVCEDKVMHAAHDWPCPTIRTLAAIYADHPDYRAEWKVGA